MNLKKWLHGHSLKLLAIRDTPEAIAGGVAIGLFFGFTPLFGLKTLCAIFFSWLTGSNIIAAVVAGTLHDVFIPVMPLIYRWEYSIGYWLLHHRTWPAPLRHAHMSAHIWSGHAWRDWRTFLRVGRPLLLGSVVCAAPPAVVIFFVTKFIVRKKHRKRDAEQEIDPP